jgi:hypothetical protein
VLCVEGAVSVDGLVVGQGRAAWVADAGGGSGGDLRVGGEGTCFVVAPGT